MSRLSMTSSSLSMATTVSDTDSIDRAPEQLFPSRWEDEKEMDKALKIEKRKLATTLRLRKINNVEDRILEGRIRSLNTNYMSVSKELRRETNVLKEEINDYKPVLELPRIESASPNIKDQSRCSSRLSEASYHWPIRSLSSQSNACLFDDTSKTSRCHHFPCFLPKTYNSIGFIPRPHTYSVLSNYSQLLQRCRGARPSTSTVKPEVTESTKALDMESHAPRTTVKEKIRGLKLLVKELKEKNEKQKPRDWATNYGAPTPRRILQKPVKSF